jgi:serine/threonine-protein kinase HipA
VTLTVWMYGTRIGTLERARATLRFTYTDEALEFGAGRPLLSVAMPVRERPYQGVVPSAFFEGLLPEGDTRKMIAYDFRVEDDAYELLRILGRDCAGALTVIPEEEEPELPGVPEPITRTEVADRLRNLPIHPLGTDQRVRVSLAGMQQKLLLSKLGEGWGLPVNGAPSTHILKPPSRDARFPNLIANEAMCLRIGLHLRLDVAAVELDEFDGIPALVIRRYDRTTPDANGRVSRIHQEDFCQAHGLDSTFLRKYESEGGPSFLQCANLLQQWSRDINALDRLLDAATLTLIVGNADGHGKNLSLLHSHDGAIQLAPIYDVFCALLYLDHSREPGMLINRVGDISALTTADLIAEAVFWGLSADAAASRVEELLARSESAIERAASELDPPEELVELLLTRARELQH